ncbi:DEKNAAC103449 [Brettanomyces naardenensis]|uniref:DEKNAAC103449 n=1 Tax=Brettanomyces naardenensis TaxID=13370 RepID=A0A448YNU8_BRENA|nr:DEKNAAC103449 [Brettanomyces naardenensis]
MSSSYLDTPSLDIFGQQLSLQIYTQITLCYKVDDPSSFDKIVPILEAGLRILDESFPYVLDEVIVDNGICKLVSFDDSPRLIVKDYRNEMDFEKLAEAHFPFRMLDEKVLAPRMTIPGTNGEKFAGNSMPVLLIQVMLIKGGVLVTFVAAHNVMDMIGQAFIIGLLDKACHGNSYSSEDIRIGNFRRDTAIPLLEDDNKIMSRASEYRVSKGERPVSPPACWKYFLFSGESLKALKKEAMSSVTSGFVSTDDALSALIWQSVARSRIVRLGGSRYQTLSRAVDSRKFVGLPPTYPGVIQDMACNRCTFQELVDKPLGLIAYELRSQIVPARIKEDVQLLATLTHRAEDKREFSLVASVDPSVDIMISSWAKVDYYNMDFNLGLGKPIAVRRPEFIPFEGLIYFMPKKSDGEIAVAISLRNEDMERLRKDEILMKYSTYIE